MHPPSYAPPFGIIYTPYTLRFICAPLRPRNHAAILSKIDSSFGECIHQMVWVCPR